jgi:hypothetical protein
MVYLAALAGLAVLYFTEKIHPRARLGTVPTAVPWFGALGGVIISFTGVFEHYANWLPSYRFWHWARPFVGAAVAIIAVLVFQAGILSVGEDIEPENATKNIFYYVLAFFIGYKEAAFRDMISRVGEVILRPGDTEATTAPTITLVDPSEAPATSSRLITINGTGLARTRTVTFASEDLSQEVTTFVLPVTDKYIKVMSPEAGQPGDVTITVFRDDGATVEHGFRFT